MTYKITLIRLDYANYKQSVSCNLQNYNNYWKTNNHKKNWLKSQQFPLNYVLNIKL